MNNKNPNPFRLFNLKISVLSAGLLLMMLFQCCHKTAPSPYSVEVTTNSDTSFGYTILRNDTPFIRQPFVPAIQGQIGFRTPEAAEKTALFVIKKLENNTFPPSVSVSELDSLNVLP